MACFGPCGSLVEHFLFLVSRTDSFIQSLYGQKGLKLYPCKVPNLSEFSRSYYRLLTALPVGRARSEVKERMKKAKADKASAKAADVKKAGGKAAKNAPRGGKVVSGKR